MNKELFIYWPNYQRDSDGGERWGGPCLTSQREYAMRWANVGVPVMEYEMVGEVKQEGMRPQ